MGRRKSGSRREFVRHVPKALGWTSIGISICSVITTWLTGHPVIGFTLGWIAFVAGMVGLVLKLLRGRTPRVTTAGLIASVVAIGVGAVVLRNSQVADTPPVTGGSRHFGPEDSGVETVEGVGKLNENLNPEDRIPNKNKPQKMGCDDPADPRPVDVGPFDPGEDPMLKRFGVATVNELDDEGAVALLRDNAVVVKDELLPQADRKLPDVLRVIELNFVKPRATDDLLRKLGPALSKLPNLRILNLFGGTVTEVGLSGVKKAPVLHEIILPLATDGVVSQLPRFNELHVVNFGKRGALSDDGLESLSGMPHLEMLDLGVTDKPTLGITDSGLKRLAALKGLKSLVISHNGITSAGMKSLTSLRHLEQLDLSQTHVDDKGLESLAELKSLKSLRLRKTAVTGSGLEHLAGCVQLQKLILSDIAEFDPDQLRHLVGHPALTELVLSGTRLNDQAVGHLPGCEIEAVTLFQK
ncbi:MAG: hypothetical protein NT069_26535 [Planctomycetota bacterium]|nr:hypothetical protein [Planctomycetota bacterium]